MLSLIYRRTRNLRAVQRRLGRTKLEKTMRYLGIEMDDALEISGQAEVWGRTKRARINSAVAIRLRAALHKCDTLLICASQLVQDFHVNCGRTEKRESQS